MKATTHHHKSAGEQQLGPVIRATREAVGLTLEEFAERAQLEAKYLRGVESGRHTPSPIIRNHLARVLADAIEQ